MWALGALDYKPEEGVLQDICKQVVQQQKRLDTQHLANLAWGFARLGWQPPKECMTAILEEARLRVRELRTQELFLLVWSCSRFKYAPLCPTPNPCTSRLCCAVAASTGVR